MDLNTLIEALRGTMDANLREAAERQLNEVKLSYDDDDDGGSSGLAHHDDRNVLTWFNKKYI